MFEFGSVIFVGIVDCELLMGLEMIPDYTDRLVAEVNFELESLIKIIFMVLFNHYSMHS